MCIKSNDQIRNIDLTFQGERKRIKRLIIRLCIYIEKYGRSFCDNVIIFFTMKID